MLVIFFLTKNIKFSIISSNSFNTCACFFYQSQQSLLDVLSSCLFILRRNKYKKCKFLFSLRLKDYWFCQNISLSILFWLHLDQEAICYWYPQACRIATAANLLLISSPKSPLPGNVVSHRLSVSLKYRFLPL